MLQELSYSDRPATFERTHPIADSLVRMTDGSMMSARQLAERFYRTEVGTSMPDQPLRYVTGFGYERGAMLDDLGQDVCPMDHQKELVRHLGLLLDVEDRERTLFSGMTDEQKGIVALACLIHDIGEVMHSSISDAGLTVVGDIPAGNKTDTDRVNEAAIRRYLYATYFSDVDSSVIEQVEAIIAHKSDDLLHELFEAAHVAQTVETSNYAYHALAQEQWHINGAVIDLRSDDGQRLSGLLGIARVAYANVEPDLTKYAHFGHIQTIADDARSLRIPEHRLYSSL